MASASDYADEWVKAHPNATPKEAYLAGYWQECDNWVKQKK